MGPIGAFRLDFGPETPQLYVLIPGPSVEALATLDLDLAKDAEFLKAADAVLERARPRTRRFCAWSTRCWRLLKAGPK